MTPFEKLQQANDDYHEAIGGILVDETVSIEGRAKFGAITSAVFNMMKQANEQIAKHYEEPEPEPEPEPEVLI